MGFKRLVSSVLSASIVLGMGSALVSADTEYYLNNSTYEDITVNGETIWDGADYHQAAGYVTIESTVPFYLETTDGTDVVAISSGTKDAYDDYVYTISDFYLDRNLTVSLASSNYISVNNGDDFIQAAEFINNGGFGNGQRTGIFLTADVTVPYEERVTPFMLSFEKDTIIDLHGWTLDSSDRWLDFTNGSEALIRNGTVKVKEHSITVNDESSLDVQDAVISCYDHNRAISVTEGSSVNIDDTVIEMDSYQSQSLISVDEGSLTINSSSGKTFLRFNDDNSHSGLLIDAFAGSSVDIISGYFSKDISKLLPGNRYVVDEGQVPGKPYHKWKVCEYDNTTLTMADGVDAKYLDQSELDPGNVIAGKEFTLTSDDLFILVTGDSDRRGVLDEDTGKYSLTVSITEPASVVVPTIGKGDYFRHVRPAESGESDHVNACAGTYFMGINDRDESVATKLESDLPELKVEGLYYAIGNVVLDVKINEYGCGIRLLDGTGTQRDPYVFGEIRTYYFRDDQYPSDKAVVSELVPGDRLEHYPLIAAEVISTSPQGAVLAGYSMFGAVAEDEVYTAELGDDGKYTLLIPAGETVTDLIYRPYNKLEGYSLSLDGSIGVNFYMSLEESIKTDEQAYMLFTLPDGTTERVYVTSLEGEERNVASLKNVDGKQYYAFQCHVAAKEMHDTVRAVFCYDDTQSEEYEFSVEDYTDALMSPEFAHLGLSDFAEAMIAYGMACDYYFGYYIEDMSSWDTFMAYACGKYDSIPDLQLPDSYDESDLPSNVKFEGTSLVLKSETKLKLYMKSDDDIMAYVGGVSVPVTRNGKYQIVELTGINALALNDDITVRIAAGNEIGDLQSTRWYIAAGYSRAVTKMSLKC